MSAKTPESAPPRERHPAVWNAAYGAAFANAVAVNPTVASARGLQRICGAACSIADMAVTALEAKRQAMSGDYMPISASADTATVDLFDVIRLSQVTVSDDFLVDAPPRDIGDVIIVHNSGTAPFRLNGYTVPAGEGRRFRCGLASDTFVREATEDDENDCVMRIAAAES